ncbi:MAG: secondary thiamine-phosphate synthase enzyme YjbQ [bacterium]
MINKINVRTGSRFEMVDITDRVNSVLRDLKAGEGICTIFVTHTTAGVTINENADPAVPKDIESGLERIAPKDAGYRHAEGNSDSHIKSSLVGPSLSVLVQGGRLVLGTWQSVFFCEFDGPRSRSALVKYIPG